LRQIRWPSLSQQCVSGLQHLGTGPIRPHVVQPAGQKPPLKQVGWFLGTQTSTPLNRQQSQPFGQRCPLQRLPPPPPPSGKQNPLRQRPLQQSRLESQRPSKPLQPRPRFRRRRLASVSPASEPVAAATEPPSKRRSAPRRLAFSRRRCTITESRSNDSPSMLRPFSTSAAWPPRTSSCLSAAPRFNHGQRGLVHLLERMLTVNRVSGLLVRSRRNVGGKSRGDAWRVDQTSSHQEMPRRGHTRSRCAPIRPQHPESARPRR
jgi:hypothetical protein